MASKKKRLAVALDIGTTYSGYAYSFTSDDNKGHKEIQTNQPWNAGTSNFLSAKTSTCLLLDGKGQFVSFGFEAENSFLQILNSKNRDSYYLFSKFKLELHKTEHVTEDMVLKDLTGKTLSAVTVFSLSIRALKNHLLDALEEQEVKPNEDDIQWVVTVPAIWSFRAKEFMRLCAKKAGIDEDSLCVALEPEVAAIFCSRLPLYKQPGEEMKGKMSQKKAKFIVLDLGGGTADLSVLQYQNDGKLKVLHKAIGGLCGGNEINVAFYHFLTLLLGTPVVDLLKEAYCSAYVDIGRAFETMKRSIKSDDAGQIRMHVPLAALNEACMEIYRKDIRKVVDESSLSNCVTIVNNCLQFDKQVVNEWFRPVIERTVIYAKDVISCPISQDITMMLLVGGFSECPLVKTAIKNAFPNLSIIIPEKADLCVLKGAVILGHEPDAIKSRVIGHTYGVETMPLFRLSEHSESHKVFVDGKERAKNVFSPIIRAGTEIEFCHAEMISYRTLERYQEKIELKLYVTDKQDVKYTTDDGCELFEKLDIEIPDPSEEYRDVIIHFTFGETILKVFAFEADTDTSSVAYIKLK